jgi:2-polyprenyl-3-methyl-5-hydroxy-6-metoxy-1,4-benzoquinol methylase
MQEGKRIMDAFECLSQYYTEYDEDARLTSRHGQVEYLTTMRYIHRYLEPGMRILEIGAGTGRYSHALAREGYRVDAVELIPHNIEVFESKTAPGEKIAVRQGNAMDLSSFGDETYDMTLVFGPLYHLYTQDDKLRVLSEALRVTKKGGIVFASYCMSDASIIGYGFKGGHIFELIEKGLLETAHFKTSSNPEVVFELLRREDIDDMISHFTVTRLHLVATDLYTDYMRETVDAMDDATFEMYLRYHFSICERPDMAGVSHHTLDIFRKL